jgi:hypothetical protein
MKSFQIVLALITFFFSLSSTQANDLEVALSSETAEFMFRSDSSVIGWGGADLAAGLFFNDDDDIVWQFSLLQARQASESSPLTFGIGLRGYAGRLDLLGENILALGVGGEVRYTIPGVMPTAFYLQAHYAPKITSFSDTESLSDVLIRYQIEILPQTMAFAGVRLLEVDTKASNNYDLDDDRLHVGIRFTF